MKDRIWLFYIVFFLAFATLLTRLFFLNVVQGRQNRDLSEGQRIKLHKISAPRGIIFDRNGQPLVKNIPIYKRCDENFSCEKISREEALRLEAQGREAELAPDVGREYPQGEAFAHVLGYLGEASAHEVEKGERKLGEQVGRTGVEEEQNSLLRGIDGGEILEVDTDGVTLRRIGHKDFIPGQDLTLTIDGHLQKIAFEALEGRKGAVVAQNPKTGEILALVSSPSFDPKYLDEALKNARLPLFNRAISGAYPPGSTFKIVTAAAGLEEGRITADTKIEDPGVIMVGTYRYANWYFTQYGKTEGVIDLVRAIKRSTDTFFYKVGELVGAQKLVVWGKAFGLGQKTGIDLPGEVSGFLPDPGSGKWFLGNTYHLSIGQGALGLTPLQVNQMTAVVASGGKLCQPHFIKPDKVTPCQAIGLKGETINLITEGMRQACSPGGTAFPFFDFQPQVACKTGTAEFGDPAGRTHAWLTAFTPYDNPEIAVTALVEAGGEGSYVAAPVVKKVMDYWFHSQ